MNENQFTPRSFDYKAHVTPPAVDAPHITDRRFVDFDSTEDVRSYFDGLEYAIQGLVMTDDTCNAILRRANVLMESDSTLEEKTALMIAYAERTALDGNLGLSVQSESFRRDLRAYIEGELGRQMTESEWVRLMQQLQVEKPGTVLWDAISSASGAVIDTKTNPVVTVDEKDGTVMRVNGQGANEVRQHLTGIEERRGLPTEDR